MEKVCSTLILYVYMCVRGCVLNPYLIIGLNLEINHLYFFMVRKHEHMLQQRYSMTTFRSSSKDKSLVDEATIYYGAPVHEFTS